MTLSHSIDKREDNRWWVRLAGAPGSERQPRAKEQVSLIRNFMGSWRRCQLMSYHRDFLFFTQVEILGDWILSWFFEWGENNFKITIVCWCAKGHDLLTEASGSCKETFSLALKKNALPPDKNSMVFQWHLLDAPHQLLTKEIMVRRDLSVHTKLVNTSHFMYLEVVILPEVKPFSPSQQTFHFH